LAAARGDLAEDLDPEESPSFAGVLSTGGLLASDPPDLREQRSGEIIVAVEEVIEPGSKITDRNGTLKEPLMDERSQAVSATVVLHPACLECGILPVVGEHEEPATLGMLDHALGKHVHVRHRQGTDRTCWFTIATHVIAS
jgi:hypothetical protein